MNNSAVDIEIQVTRLLHGLGIPASVKGYTYVREAILLSVADFSIMNRVTKSLYPAIAAQFDTTPPRVERAIRHAVELAWERGSLELINEIFGYTVNSSKGKPTNSEFISLIADTVRLDMRHKAGVG